MFSPEIHCLVVKEQKKDLLADIENQRLLQIAGFHPAVTFKSVSKTINQLGTQLIIWGAKLQSYDPTPISTTTANKIR